MTRRTPLRIEVTRLHRTVKGAHHFLSLSRQSRHEQIHEDAMIPMEVNDIIAFGFKANATEPDI